MPKYLFGALTVAAADVVLMSQIPTTAEAEAILASTVSAEELDKINRATTMLQNFFAVRKQLKANKVKIASIPVGIIPADIITKNNLLLAKTDDILSAAYNANGKQLLPFQDPDDIPLATAASMAGYLGAATSGEMTEKEVIEIVNETKGVTKAINEAIVGPKIATPPPIPYETGMNKATTLSSQNIIKWIVVGGGALFLIKMLKK